MARTFSHSVVNNEDADAAHAEAYDDAAAMLDAADRTGRTDITVEIDVVRVSPHRYDLYIVIEDKK